MHDLTLARPMEKPAEALTPLLGRPLTAWFVRAWRAAARHAERPDRFVPYC